ncbi:MAG: HDOD domain-containing protein [bacterium]|nr:HDOD domain-containing protein [bacterium]
MNRVEFKRRLDGLRRLPITVYAASRAVPLLGDPGSSRKALLTLVLSDPCLAARVLRAGSGHALPPNASGAIRRIDDRTLRRLVLLAATETLFPAINEVPHGRELAEQALGTAVFAERLAARTENVSTQDAYVAGLLADVGSLVLASLEPEAFVDRVSRHAASPGDVLQTERQAFGFDHTQAGKWIAERWRFPQAISEAIWLHHHPANAFEGGRFATGLIEVTGLAVHLRQTLRDGGRPNEAVFARAHRLGIGRETLEALFTEGARAVEQSLAFFADDAPDPVSACTELKRVLYEFLDASPDAVAASAVQSDRSQFLEALERMDRRLHPRMTLDAILSVFIDAVRQGVGLAPGVCCVIDSDGRHLHGKRWHTTEGRLNPLFIDLEATESLSPDLQGALRTLGFGKGGRGWTGTGLLDVSRKGGLIVVPLLAEGRGLGQVLFEVESAGDRLGEPLLANLTALAGVCARAVARQHEEERQEAQSEDLILSMRDAPPVAEPSETPSPEASNERALVQGLAEAVGRPVAELLIRVGQLRETGNESVIAEVARSGERLEDLVAGMRGFCNPLQPKMETTAIDHILHQHVLTVEDDCAKHGIRFQERRSDGLPRVMCDQGQMGRAVQALIANACEAMTPGGGVITLGTSAASERGGIVLSVADTGPGIEPADVPRVFAPFYTTKRKEGHAGLGLSLCKSIVEAHSGTIELTSRVGEGTEIRLTLPAVADRQAEPPADDPPAAEPEKLPRVLVVDDDEGVREILKRTLQMRGCVVETASDGVEAMESLTGDTVDLVLLDICMPRKDGLAVLQELEEQQAAFPVIVMTGSTRPYHVEEALKRGARTCLRKPFELKQLLAEVESAVAEGRG